MSELDSEQKSKVLEIMKKLEEDKKENMKSNKTCPSCGNAIPVDSVFCPFCGTAVPNDAEMKKKSNQQVISERPTYRAEQKTETIPSEPEIIKTPLVPMPETKKDYHEKPEPQPMRQTERQADFRNVDQSYSEPSAKISNPSFNTETFKESIANMNIPEKTKGIKSIVDKMYENVGDALCRIAKVVFYIGAFFSILSGMGMIFGGCGRGFGGSIGGFFIGITVMALGIFVSWISTLALYAFGEITRRLKSLDEKTK